MRVFFTGSDVALRAGTAPMPEPGTGEVLVRTRAAAFGNSDLSPSGAEHVAGYEFSGDVVSTGPGVRGGTVGRRVMGIAAGTFAEYVVAHERQILAVPETLSHEDAAALPTGLASEYGALRAGGMAPGRSVLLTAASSSLGLLGIQVAKELGAGTVIATTRSRQKAAALERAGADVVLVVDNDGLADAVRAATGGAGADLVLDHIGGEALDGAVAAAVDGGDVVSIGRLGGGRAAIDLFALARRHVLLRSVSYGLSPHSVLGDLFDALEREVMPAVTAGRIVPVVDGVFAFEDSGAALDRLRSGLSEGKVVVSLG